MKYVGRTVIAIALVSALVAAIFIAESRRFESLEPLPVTRFVRGKFTRVALIGDSWVARGGLDKPLAKYLADYGMRVSFVRSGHSGANTRQLYRDLIFETDERRSKVNIFSDAGIWYCVIVAGVNDTASHLGADFYAHHMAAIVKVLLANNITPVVVEVPEYGIEEISSVGIISGLKRFIFRYFFDGGKVDVIRDYRSALTTLLQQENIRGVIMVYYDAIAADYSSAKALYSDPAHLNEAGNDRLAGVIVRALNQAQSAGRP